MKKETTSSRTSRRSAGMQSALNLALVIFILLVVNYLGFKFYSHKDLSSSQFYSLSPKTKDVLRNLTSPVHITTLVVSQEGVPFWDQTQNLLKEYQRVGGKNVTLEKVDEVFNMARATELKNRLHFEGATNLIIFEYKDRSRFVKQQDLLEIDPMTQQVGGYKGEQAFTSAIVALVEGKPSRVYFTTGHGERGSSDNNPAGYGLIAGTLKVENIDIGELNLAGGGEVPADADAVVVAGAAVPFSPQEAQAIDKYLAANGKLLVLLDPFSPLGLDDVLKKYGLGFDNDIARYRHLNSAGLQATYSVALIYPDGFSHQPITAPFRDAGYALQINDARSVRMEVDNSQPNPKVQSLMQTGADSWGWVPPAATPRANAPASQAVEDMEFNKATDIPGPLTISAVYDGGTITDATTKAPSTATRIVLVGSAQFLENDVAPADAIGVNFFINAIDWMVKKNAVLDIGPKKPTDYGISLSPMQERTVNWTALFFVPGLALALGVFTWFSRRK